MKRKTGGSLQGLSPSEQRAARSERVKVFEAEPFGWIAFSETGTERKYHLYQNPETKNLVCTCADYVFRGNDDPYFECKHISATLKFIARCYLAQEYEPQRQRCRAA